MRAGLGNPQHVRGNIGLIEVDGAAPVSQFGGHREDTSTAFSCRLGIYRQSKYARLLRRLGNEISFFEYVLNRTVLLVREADSENYRDFKIENAGITARRLPI